MAEFEDKLNSILGNQEAMNQIMALARSLSGDQPHADPVDRPEEDVPTEPVPDQPAPDLSSLIEQIDPQMIQIGMDVMRQIQSTDSRSAALLDALRPFLREDRRARLDRALQLSRVIKMVRTVMGRGKEGERV